MLRNRHRAVIQKILNLNQPLVENNLQASLDWKVLIYDNRGLSILSTLLKVSKLLEVGVTYYGLITQRRDPIPDVTAVYLLEPTPENLRLMAQDCATPLYDKMYINFLSPISSYELENFASQVRNFSDGQNIKFIYDQCIDFYSPDPNLFTLYDNINVSQTSPTTFHTLPNLDYTMPSIFGFNTTDEAMENACKSIASSLFSVFLTAGEIPRILYPKGSQPANLVAQAFSEFLRPYSQDYALWESRRGDSPVGKPPLLLLFDRSIDFASQVHHPCTYQALIHDQFGISKNQVKVNGKQYDLDTDIDKFWTENRSKTFDTVLESIGKEANEFKTAYGAIENDINSAIKNLPELSHKRLSLETNTKIAEALVKAVKDKQADNMFKFEEDIVLQSIDINKLIEFLLTIPDQNDRLRCAAFAYFAKVFSKDQIERVQAEAQIGASLNFLTKYDLFRIDFKKDSRISSMLQRVSPFGSQSDSNAFASKLPLVETTRIALDVSSDDFNYLNPITLSTNKESEMNSLSQNSVYVFMIGPGNYVEYQGLLEYGKKTRREISYGCTSMIRPSDFIDLIQKI